MKKELSTSFDTRQHMKSEDFEIFYYKDLNLSQVSLHIHSHYEFYYFVEGSVSYRLGDNEYLLEPGDCLLIPPGLCSRNRRPAFSTGSGQCPGNHGTVNEYP